MKLTNQGLRPHGRNQFLDVLKGVAMLIVILGHAFQGARHGETDIAAHRFILHFQMEFFFLLSGFAAAYSVGKPISKRIRKLAGRLGLPYLTWIYLFYLAEVSLGVKGLNLHDGFMCVLISGFWFLRCLLLISFAFLSFDVKIRAVQIGPILTAVILLIISLLPGQDLVPYYAIYFAIGYIIHRLCRRVWPHLTVEPTLPHAVTTSLAWCGRNSLGLYAIHWNIFFVFISLQLFDFTRIAVPGTASFAGLVTGLFVLYLLGSTMAVLLIKRVPVASKLLLGE